MICKSCFQRPAKRMGLCTVCSQRLLQPQPQQQIAAQSGLMQVGNIGSIVHYDSRAGTSIPVPELPITSANKEKKSMFSFYGDLKTYIRKHGDILFTILFIVLLDKWLFQGTFKKSLEGLVEKLLGRAHKELDKTDTTK